ncbi:hypothetical protein [[Mycobacterium] holstebronense]|uniref:Tox-REase-7 domain-containing protein n=1 Tax=[Mycobacterium] holstebronense TaxID=3064288 RepID=A0ABN9NV07_9MYCO|nr:hypothetical protein [Mycolicibacter sp. MU0102]CAJ1510167.1 hypothetical protein MU0102_004032 [Mycolicibacter sp. MU0102]
MIGRTALEILTGLLGEGTASAPGSPEQARHDFENNPSVSYTRQAVNIALFMLPIERVLGTALSGARRLLTLGRGTTTAEKAFLRDLASVGGGAERSATQAARPTGVPKPSAPQAGSDPLRHVVDEDLEAFMREFRSEPHPAPGGRTPAPHLARGNFGERMAADRYARDGHRILSYKPDIAGTNQGGIDLVTIKDGIVRFVDNKALSRGGNVSSVTALTKNFNQNVAKVLVEFEQHLARTDISQAERQLIQEARDAIRAGKFERIVTNANLNSSISTTGVTETLRKEGIKFVDIMRQTQ